MWFAALATRSHLSDVLRTTARQSHQPQVAFITHIITHIITHNPSRIITCIITCFPSRIITRIISRNFTCHPSSTMPVTGPDRSMKCVVHIPAMLSYPRHPCGLEVRIGSPCPMCFRSAASGTEQRHLLDLTMCAHAKVEQRIRMHGWKWVLLCGLEMVCFEVVWRCCSGGSAADKASKTCCVVTG